MLQKKDIIKLADEAKIHLDDAEAEVLLSEFNSLLDRAETMKLIQTDDIPTTKSTLENVYDENDLTESEIALFEVATEEK